MLVQTPSKIFKADLRNWDVSDFIKKSEIISEDFFAVKEIILENNQEISLEIAENKTVILLPLFGEIYCRNKTVTANEILEFGTNTKETIMIKNNYEEEIADFLIIEIKENSILYATKKSEIIILKNALSKISERLSYPNYIGLFEGRQEMTYKLENKNHKIFGLVLNGAFEFQNRLLENRDAIILSEIETLEFEALSENALILFFEIKIKTL